MSQSLYFIDTKLSDYQSIIDSLSFTDTYYLINSDSDGFTQMASILSGYSDLDALHVFSHGSIGSLNLGSTIVNQSNISSYELLLQQIGGSLSANGDILLYGCNVGEGIIGQAFIDSIAGYTGADVAASNDLTGSSALGGDWELETTAGAIEASIIAIDGYNKTLYDYYSYTVVVVGASLVGSDFNDNMYGDDRDNSILGSYGDDIIEGGIGNDTLSGDWDNDTLKGDTGNDTLFGGDGNDTLIGGEGDDYLAGGIYYGVTDGGNYTDIYHLSVGAGNDVCVYTSGINSIVFSNIASTDVMTLFGITSSSFKLQYTANDSVTFLDDNSSGYSFTTTFTFSDGVSMSMAQLAQALQPIHYVDTDVSNSIYGSIYNDSIIGNGGDDFLDGGYGNDTYRLSVGSGNDIYWDDYGANNIIFSDIASTDLMILFGLSSTEFKLQYTANDSVEFTDDNSYGYSFTTTFTFSDGVSMSVAQLAQALQPIHYVDTDVSNSIYGSIYNDSIVGNGGDDILRGYEGNDTLEGGEGNDILDGGYGNDILEGGGGDDTLKGGYGNDTYRLSVGSGNDIYWDDYGANNIIFSDIASTDVMTLFGLSSTEFKLQYTANDSVEFTDDYSLSTTTFTFSDGVSMSVAQLAQALQPIHYVDTDASKSIYGSIYNDSIVGNGGDDILCGYEGNDTLEGGEGNDILYGWYGDDTLIGGAGNDTLSGWYGNDTYRLSVGSGNDDITDNYDTNSVIFSDIASTDVMTLFGITSSSFKLQYTANDTVSFLDDNYDINVNTTTFSFSDGVSMSVAQLAQALQPIHYVDTDVSNSIYGSIYNDSIVGNGGDDTLDGGEGIDIAVYASAASDYTITKNADGTIIVADTIADRDGTDTLTHIEMLKFSDSTIELGSVNTAPTSANVTLSTNEDTAKVLTLSNFAFTDVDAGDTLATVEITTLPTAGSLKYGTALVTLNQVITASDITAGKLTFAPAANTFGNAYSSFGFKVSDGTAYSITESTTTFNVIQIIDTTSASFTTTLAPMIENLILTGIAAINGTGNVLNNTITGNSAANVIDGKAGADIMLGGAGNDTYYVDNIGDKVYETTTETSGINSGGTDLVISTVNYTLGSFVENLRVINTTTAVNATGNTLNNTIYAGTGNNTLNGATGTDTLSYAYATSTTTAGLKVSLAVTTAQVTGISGSDTILNFENLTGSNYADTLTGNAAANILDGLAGNDTLNGGLGNDTIYGGLGNDTLTGGTGNDYFVFNTAFNASANKDTITDFNTLYDTIKLENGIFTKLTATGTLATASFVSNTTGKAVDANDYIVYETDTGKLFYDVDGSGAGVAVQIALIGTSTHAALTAADFSVI